MKGCDGSEEDVLASALFPQVAPRFFGQRAEGPKNVSKSPAPSPAQPAAAAAFADGKGPVSSPVTYLIRVGDRSHQVTVQPA